MLLAFLLLSGIVVACGGSDASGESDTGDDQATTTTLEVIIPETTKVISAAAGDVVDTFDDNTGTLVFSASSSELSAVAPGDIVASDASGAAPSGYLRRVTAISQEGGGLVLQTEPALLTDAIQQGSASFSTRIRPEDLLRTRTLDIEGLDLAVQGGGPPGFWAGARALGDDEGKLVDCDGLTCTVDICYPAPTPGVNAAGEEIDCGETTAEVPGAYGFHASGEFAIDPDFDFDITIDWGDLYIKAKIGAKLTADIKVDAWGALNWEREWPLVEHSFGPYTIWLGPFPLVLTPVITLYLRADASIVARVGFGAQGSVEMAAGFKYDSDEGFEPINKFPEPDWHTNWYMEGKADLGAAVGVDVLVLLYEAAGPSIILEGGPRLRADLAGVIPDGDVVSLGLCGRLAAGFETNPYLDWNKHTVDLWFDCWDMWDVENVPVVLTDDEGQARFGIAVAQPAVAEAAQGTGEIVITPDSDGPMDMKPVGLTLSASLEDTIGQHLECKWDSDVEGDVFEPSHSEHEVFVPDGWSMTDGVTWPDDFIGAEACDPVAVVLPTAGRRTITLTITDGNAGDRTWSTRQYTQQILVRSPRATWAHIGYPTSGEVLARDEEITLRGSAQSDLVVPTGLTCEWTISYPTDASGASRLTRFPGVPGTYAPTWVIGRGCNLPWVPADTPAVTVWAGPVPHTLPFEFVDPGVVPQCARASEYARIELNMFNELLNETLAPVWIVVGFENPFYSAAACEGGSIDPGDLDPGEPTTTTWTLTPPSFP